MDNETNTELDATPDNVENAGETEAPVTASVEGEPAISDPVDDSH